MPAHLVEHVVEKRDAGRKLRPASAVDRQPDGDVGLGRAPVDVRDAGRSRAALPGLPIGSGAPPADVATDGTFTLSNSGSFGTAMVIPIINQPQVAILGTGAVVKRPIVVTAEDGETIAIRSMVYLALSYDHRIVDGADAARFLVTVKDRLEEGDFAAELGL